VTIFYAKPSKKIRLVSCSGTSIREQSERVYKSPSSQYVLILLDILREVKVVKAVHRMEGLQLFQPFTVVILCDHVKQRL
jgi:hypothetical protein